MASAHVEREYMLIGVHGTPAELADVVLWCGVFRGAVVSRTSGAVVIELSGAPDRLAAALRLLKPQGKHRVVRSGVLVMPRDPLEIPATDVLLSP